MALRTFVSILVVALACPAFAQDEKAPAPPRESALLICYPNAPGTSRSAAGVMEQLGHYLSDRGESARPEYFNEVSLATRWLQTKRPRFGVLSLAMFLRWRQEHGLSVVALSERHGASAQSYSLLVHKSSPLEDLAGLATLDRPARVWSSHLDDLRFANRVVFAGQLTLGNDDGKVRLVSTKQPLRALRRLKKGEAFEGKPVDAVLVDAVTWNGLQRLKTFRGVLRVLYTSPALPTPPVVAFRGVKTPRREKMRSVLGTMTDDPDGRLLLKTLQVTGFRPVTSEVMKKAVAAYEGDS